MTNSVIQRDMILAVARRRWDYFIIRLGSDKTAAMKLCGSEDWLQRTHRTDHKTNMEEWIMKKLYKYK